jgi:hypothetical protein
MIWLSSHVRHTTKNTKKANKQHKLLKKEKLPTKNVREDGGDNKGGTCNGGKE